jgi:hypothetical protein
VTLPFEYTAPCDQCDNPNAPWTANIDGPQCHCNCEPEED